MNRYQTYAALLGLGDSGGNRILELRKKKKTGKQGRDRMAMTREFPENNDKFEVRAAAVA